MKSTLHKLPYIQNEKNYEICNDTIQFLIVAKQQRKQRAIFSSNTPRFKALTPTVVNTLGQRQYVSIKNRTAPVPCFYSCRQTGRPNYRSNTDRGAKIGCLTFRSRVASSVVRVSDDISTVETETKKNRNENIYGVNQVKTIGDRSRWPRELTLHLSRCKNFNGPLARE